MVAQPGQGHEHHAAGHERHTHREAFAERERGLHREGERGDRAGAGAGQERRARHELVGGASRGACGLGSGVIGNRPRYAEGAHEP